MGPAKTIGEAIVLTKTTQINMGRVEMIYCLDLFRIDQTDSKQWRIAAYACTSGGHFSFWVIRIFPFVLTQSTLVNK